MKLRAKTTILFFILWLGAACLIPFDLVRASVLNITINGSRIDLQAEDVPLIEILNAISEKAGILVMTSDPLSDPVSLKISDAPVEQCLRRLLGNRSYSLMFTKNASGEIIPVRLVVLGKDFVPPVQQASAPPSDDHMKRFRKEWIQKELGDVKKVTQQLSATSLKDGPEERGIRITRLNTGSSLEKIGLKQGDIIDDVNGKPVRTVEEFAQLIETASGEEQPIIRIERLTGDRSMDPIYIELH